MKSNASLIYNLFLIVGDFLALVAAFVGAFIVRAQSSVPVAHPISGRTYFYIFLGVLPFWILIFALLGLYNSTIYERRFSEFGRLLIGSFIGMLFVIFWNFLSVTPIFPAKLVPIYGFGLGFLFLVIFRNVARLIRTELFSFNIGLTHVALVGSSPMTRKLIASLSDTRHSGYKVIAVVGDKRQVEHYEIPAYPSFQEFIKSSPRNVHRIIQTELYANEARNSEILTYAQENHVAYRFVPGNSELFVGNIDVELFQNSVPVIAVRQTPLFGWGRVAKRLFDLVVGSVLLVLVSPLILIISLIMIVFDHGDPIWRNKRLSRFGTEIGMYKFRTQLHAYHRMSPEAGFAKMGRPELAVQYRANGDFLENDPRISRLGRFLRATSLDELPQLLNVVKGDMSLVGPRPLEPFELSTYDKKNLMLSVKTGITGLAVVSGRRDISFEERRKLDLYYVQNWSFWLDIVILLKTVRAVVSRVGAK
jgi:exopolysaccharide biosynthesis polyprenyl glycosylphosphotransferase